MSVVKIEGGGTSRLSECKSVARSRGRPCTNAAPPGSHSKMISYDYYYEYINSCVGPIITGRFIDEKQLLKNIICIKQQSTRSTPKRHNDTAHDDSCVWTRI